jgi:hypothetical protein
LPLFTSGKAGGMEVLAIGTCPFTTASAAFIRRSRQVCGCGTALVA